MSSNPVDILNPIKKFTIGDGYDMILDLEKSEGMWLYDSKSDLKYLDFFSFFASAPLGMNHPKMLEDEEFLNHLKNAALNKVSNSDIYTTEMANFIETFTDIAVPEPYEHLFFISGGALAVENALKASFDWKIRKNFEKGYEGEQGTQILHFKEAFHGRSGYTLSLTNTADPRKYQYFPKFNWPRVTNPKITYPLNETLEDVIETEEKAIQEINDAFNQRKDDIAAIIIEPIQGEGGDNHFREEFLRELKDISVERDAMLIFDEIQTGIGMTGKMWANDHLHGVDPDMIVFGKKTQVCGFMANERVDEVERNVFKESSRINSTWGGNIVDMVRSAKYLEIIKEEKLIKNAEKQGTYILKRMEDLSQDLDGYITNVRGKGLFAAFDLPSTERRDSLKKELYDNNIMMLGSGTKSMRFRPPLLIEKEHIDLFVDKLETILRET